MLVCNISQRPPRRIIAADLAEAALANDDSTTGLVVFATLVDDPAAVVDTVDAYLGEVMVEAASAADDVDGRLPSTIAASGTEAASAAHTQDATVVSGIVKTWNPADLVNITLSNGNLTATSGSSSAGVRAACSVTSGKVYWEFTLNTITSSQTAAGCARSTANLANPAGLGTANMAIMFGNGVININTAFQGTIGTRTSGDVIGVAVDFTNSLIWFRVAPSGNWNGSGTANPATGTGGFSISGITGGALYPYFATTNLANEQITGNFGASAFTGAVPSGFSAGF